MRGEGNLASQDLPGAASIIYYQSSVLHIRWRMGDRLYYQGDLHLGLFLLFKWLLNGKSGASWQVATLTGRVPGF